MATSKHKQKHTFVTEVSDVVISALKKTMRKVKIWHSSMGHTDSHWMLPVVKSMTTEMSYLSWNVYGTCIILQWEPWPSLSESPENDSHCLNGTQYFMESASGLSRLANGWVQLALITNPLPCTHRILASSSDTIALAHRRDDLNLQDDHSSQMAALNPSADSSPSQKWERIGILNNAPGPCIKRQQRG